METYRFAGRDGIELAYRESGEGRPLIMLHGFMGTGSQMFEYGRADEFAAHGSRVIVPDFRGHGESARPTDAASYPKDILTEDSLALIEHLGLADGEYDLGGYSLGARIVVRMLARGAKPRRAIVAGQGLAKVAGPQGGGRNQQILTDLVNGIEPEPGTPDAGVVGWMKKLGADPQSMLYVLASMVPTSEDELRKIDTPTLVAIGDRDERADADELAALMPNSKFVRVPGDHGTSFGAPELAAAINEFLADH